MRTSLIGQILQFEEMTARFVLRSVVPAIFPSKTPCQLRWSSLPNRGEMTTASASRRGMSALEELQRERQAEEAGTGPTIGTFVHFTSVIAFLVRRIDYERPLKVVSYPDPKLRLPNARIQLPAEGVEQLAEDMFEVMYKYISLILSHTFFTI